jgi:hypothetical protein
MSKSLKSIEVGDLVQDEAGDVRLVIEKSPTLAFGSGDPIATHNLLVIGAAGETTATAEQFKPVGAQSNSDSPNEMEDDRPSGMPEDPGDS